MGEKLGHSLDELDKAIGQSKVSVDKIPTFDLITNNGEPEGSVVQENGVTYRISGGKRVVMTENIPPNSAT